MTYYQKSHSLPLKGLRPLIPRTTETLTKIENKKYTNGMNVISCQE